MIVQLTIDPLSFSSAATLGNAMFTAVMSRITINWAVRSTPSSASPARECGADLLVLSLAVVLVLHRLVPFR